MDARRAPDRDGLVEIVRVLVLMQGAMLVASTIQAAFFASNFPQAGRGAVVLTGLATIATFAALWGLGRGAGWARRLTYAGEAFVLAGAIVDELLALGLSGAPLGLVATLTRVVVPVAVIVLLRRSRERRPRATEAGLTAVGALAVAGAAGPAASIPGWKPAG